MCRFDTHATLRQRGHTKFSPLHPGPHLPVGLASLPTHLAHTLCPRGHASASSFTPSICLSDSASRQTGHSSLLLLLLARPLLECIRLLLRG
jgi:hypothetical protein